MRRAHSRSVISLGNPPTPFTFLTLPSLQVPQAHSSSYSSTSDPSIEEESVHKFEADDKELVEEEDGGGEERQQWSNPIEFLLREELELMMTNLPHDFTN